MITTFGNESNQTHNNSPGMSHALALADYGMALSKQGLRVIPVGDTTLWVNFQPHALMRVPTFCLSMPEPDEVRQLLRLGKVAVLSYALEPDAEHRPNATLYLCSDHEYSLDSLRSEMRRNVSLALRRLRIEPLTAEQLLAHGLQAFSDTRARHGLSDGTSDEFRRRFTAWVQCPAHVFLGAWKEDVLTAFLSIIEVDDWAEIEGTFSMTTYRNLKPNDGLNYVALHHYLRNKQCRVVSYGLSSIQDGNHDGLHTFKTKVGFEARPVHRAFALNPLVAPLVNRLTLNSVKAALCFRPSNKLLRKAAGMMSIILDSTGHRQPEM